jgi:D-beta-D-heptose 7-phosphate kinase/D-beta-D-heptose 1-phosphate adenosyltransferase
MAGFPHNESDPFEPELVVRSIYEKYRPNLLVITLGREGMLVSANGGDMTKHPTVAKDVFDVSGAGDTVIAALTLALCAGHSTAESVHFANVCAGVVVGKLGTATITPGEIVKYAM